jgi:hypothetical protein
MNSPQAATSFLLIMALNSHDFHALPKAFRRRLIELDSVFRGPAPEVPNIAAKASAAQDVK